jgi:hypothetical protein
MVIPSNFAVVKSVRGWESCDKIAAEQGQITSETGHAVLWNTQDFDQYYSGVGKMNGLSFFYGGSLKSIT